MNKTILVIGVDSDIGREIANQHILDGDIVETTSRNGNGTYNVELAHPLTWPKIDIDYDIVYYCIGIGDRKNSRMEVMQMNAFISCDFLMRITSNVKDNGKIVVLSSEWGSIEKARTDNGQTLRAISYRMSKAALNMGVVLLSKRWKTINWILMHPGLVQTKMTSVLTASPTNAEIITPQKSAIGVISSVANCDKQIAFIDYNGKTVEW